MVGSDSAHLIGKFEKLKIETIAFTIPTSWPIGVVKKSE
jgi:hypothetical protein